MMLALPLAFVIAAAPPRDTWFGADKLKHFFTAAVVQSLSYSAVRATGAEHRAALRTAWGVTAVVSIGKEIRDRHTTELFSVRDLVWDTGGALLATAMLNHSERHAERRDESARTTIAAYRLSVAPRTTFPTPVLQMRLR